MRSAVIAGAVGLVALAGCGGSSDTDEVRQVATQLATANPKVCDHLTDAFLKQFGNTRDACRKGARASKQPDAEVGAIEVKDDRATAALSQGGVKATISFVKDGDDWKISSAQ